MNHTHHPISKFERHVIDVKKSKSPATKRQEAKDRSGKVYRKLTVEHIREQETEDELRAAAKGFG